MAKKIKAVVKGNKLKIILRDCKSKKMVRMRGLEPPHLAALDPKSSVYTNFTTSAHVVIVRFDIVNSALFDGADERT